VVMLKRRQRDRAGSRAAHLIVIIRAKDESATIDAIRHAA
jgi:hypothetical protein